jgi:hypothetical protein
MADLGPETLKRFAQALWDDGGTLTLASRNGLCDYASAWEHDRQRIEELESATRDALSDLEWAERTLPGTNFQASIIKLRLALAGEQSDAAADLKRRVD